MPKLLNLMMRMGLTAAGIAAVGWGLITIPTFWAERDLREMAARILNGEGYRPELMRAADEHIAANMSSLQPSALSAVATLRLREAEIALNSNDTAAADASLAALDRALDQALASSPSESFIWLMRFWTKNVQSGLGSESLRNLEESYIRGPNEGWIAIKRCNLAFPIFLALPPTLSKAVVGDFVDLVSSGLVIQASELLIGPGSSIRNVLLGALSPLSEPARRNFAEILYGKASDGFAVPGIDQEVRRVWQR